ncbi:hypothetical protein, partial [Megamonas funiformis]
YELEIREKNIYANIEEFEKKYENRLRLQKNIEDKICRIEEIRKTIRDKDDMRKYEFERDECRSKIRYLQEKIDILK